MPDLVLKRIVIFDDNEDYAKSLKDNLESSNSPLARRWNIQVKIVQTTELLMRVNKSTDLFIIDVNINDREEIAGDVYEEPPDGPETIKKLFTMLSWWRPCIIITGQSNVDLDQIRDKNRNYEWFRAFLTKDGNMMDKIEHEIDETFLESGSFEDRVKVVREELERKGLLKTRFPLIPEIEQLKKLAVLELPDNGSNETMCDECLVLYGDGSDEDKHHAEIILKSLRDQLYDDKKR